MSSTESSKPTAGTTRVDHLGASTFVEKGWSRLSTGDAVGADNALRRALELAPNNVEAGALLAWSFIQQERFDAARLLLDRVRAVDDQYALAMTVSGLLALRTGETARAVEVLQTAKALSSFDRRASLYAHLYLGMAQRVAGQHTSAVETLRAALALGPNFLEAAYELGQTLLQQGETIAAIDTWRAAASANKFSPWGKRCAELVALHERGESPVAV